LKVSIIIPCYNVEQYLEECLTSAINQSYQDIEIIAVDNNSNDGTYAMLKNFQIRYPRLIKVLQENKQGAAAARNKGLSIANGEWVQFLDADDIIMSEKLSQQIGLIERESHLIVAGYFNKGRVKTKTLYPYTKNQWLALYKSQLGITSSNLWNKKAVIDCGGWNEDLSSSQEYELLFRLFQQGYRNVVIHETPNTIVRRRPNSISTNIDAQKPNKENFISLRLDILNYLKTNEEELYLNVKKQLYEFLLFHLFSYYHFDQKKASQIFQEYIPKDLKVATNEYGSVFRILFNNFGFQMGSKLFSHYLKLKKNNDYQL